MSIPFTQYLRPKGRKVQVEIDRPEYIEVLAEEFIEKGGYFECEELLTGHVSFTAGHRTVDWKDIAGPIVVMNGPDVLEAVDRLVHKAYEWLMEDRDGDPCADPSWVREAPRESEGLGDSAIFEGLSTLSNVRK